MPSIRQTITRFRPHVWRLPLLILLIGISAAGWYAFQIKQVSVRLGYPNAVSKQMLVLRRELRNPQANCTLVVSEQGDVLHKVKIQNWRSEPRWTPDRNLVGVTGFHPSDRSGRTLVKVDLGVDAKVIPLTHDVPGVSDAFCTKSGDIIHVETPGGRNKRRAFVARFVRNQKTVIAEIEYRDEDVLNIYMQPSYDGSDALVLKRTQKVKLGVPRNESAEVVRLTAFERMDPTTGELTDLSLQPGYLVANSAHHIAYNEGQNWSVFDTRSSQQTFLFPDASLTMPTMISEGRIVQFEHDREYIQLFTADGSPPKVIPTLKASDMKPYDDDHVLIASEDAIVEKVNLTTGERQTIFRARPWGRTSRAFALVGLPAFAVLWLLFAIRFRQLSPMAELVLVVMLTLTALLFWMRNALEEAEALNLCFILLSGTALTFVTLWATNVRSLHGRGIPILLLGVAATLRLIVWRQSDGCNVMTNAEQLNTAGAFIALLVIGMLLIRRFARRFECVEITIYHIKEKQLSLGQIVLLTCGFATYFGVVRATGMSFQREIDVSLFWFPTVYALLVLIAYYFSLSRQAGWRFAGLLAFLLLAIVVLVPYDANVTYETNPFQERRFGNTLRYLWGEHVSGARSAYEVYLHPHLHPVYNGLTVFAALAYCRRYAASEMTSAGS